MFIVAAYYDSTVVTRLRNFIAQATVMGLSESIFLCENFIVARCELICFILAELLLHWQKRNIK